MLPRNDSNKWYYGVVWVLLALIGLGPFGFPLLWKSPQFSLTWKVLLMVLVTAGTVYLIAASWEIYALLIREITALKKQGLI